MAFYVLDENNNKIEAFDKEGVLAVLSQAIEDGSLDNITGDSAFISKIKCCVNGISNNIAFITQAKYNELEANGELKNNTYYYITDDTAAEDINAAFEELNEKVNASVRAISINRNVLTATFGNDSTKDLTLNANLLMPNATFETTTIESEVTSGGTASAYWYGTNIEFKGIYSVYYNYISYESHTERKVHIGIVCVSAEETEYQHRLRINDGVDGAAYLHDATFIFKYTDGRVYVRGVVEQNASWLDFGNDFSLEYIKIGEVQ